MLLSSLRLQNFRIYENAKFEFHPRVNIISGPNAVGKTSLLEAIYFLVTGRSFRNGHAVDLLRQGASAFLVEACFVRHGVEQTIRVCCDGKEKKIFYNNAPCSSSVGLLGLLKGVVFSPDDASLVKGAPALRRQFLDYQIAQVDPLYVHHLTRFHRSMRQRNCLLKARSTTAIEGWENEMAVASAYVTAQRATAAADLDSAGCRLHDALTGENTKLSLTYKSSAPDKIDLESLRKHFMHQYHRMRKRELELGCTLIGPHRDDLAISIGLREARVFGSEGQQRSCVAALRLAEWERLKAIGNEVPLMLIDDVGISLDDKRRELLLDHLYGLGQIFLTTTQRIDIPGYIIPLP